jgi:hypothetical protein
MAQKTSMLNKVDYESVSEYNDRSIKNRITTKLEYNINIAGTEFYSFEEAIVFAYRCGLAEQSRKNRESIGMLDQDELYKILKKSHSKEHKADFLREIAKEWFPIDSEKKIRTVHIELNELANYLEK